jgi:hypothetical protein
MRTTFVSWLGAAGVDVRVAQRLARHTDIRLTTATYQDFRLLDTHGAVGKLPNLWERAESQGVVMQATGTDDALPKEDQTPVVRPVVLNNGERGVKASEDAQSVPRLDTSERARFHGEKRGFPRRQRARETLGATGFEPATS